LPVLHKALVSIRALKKQTTRNRRRGKVREQEGRREKSKDGNGQFIKEKMCVIYKHKETVTQSLVVRNVRLKMR
jgi:hypothetical protein